MAERTYITSAASIVAVNGQNVAVPLGLVFNLTLERTFVIEPLLEWGSYRPAELIIHGYGARFSWGKAYSKGIDLVEQGLIPSAAGIPQFAPIGLRVIDFQSGRNIALLYQALAETITLSGAARASLQQNVSGIAVDVLFESEVN